MKRFLVVLLLVSPFIFAQDPTASKMQTAQPSSSGSMTPTPSDLVRSGSQSEDGLISKMDIIFPAQSQNYVSPSSSIRDAGSDDRAHLLMSEAINEKPNACPSPNFASTAECHQQFDDGCTLAKKPNYDAYLDFMKNVLPSPDSGTPISQGTFTSLDDFTALDAKTIAMNLGKSPQVQFSDKLADLGEGNIYTAVGYIYYAKKGGIETCNCKLTAQSDIDIHIGLGFDPKLAAKIASGAVKNLGSGASPSVQKTSVIVEMTPHYRAKYHERWTVASIEKLKGRQVKIVGQLIVDNEHNISSQNCAFATAGPNCWRASVWELHPVIELYTCSSAAPCQADSDDGWEPVE